ncbi:MAG: tagaturonate epimerase family protein [Bacteroidales bacterium]
MQIEKFSFGIGDRFAHQGEAQLQAFIMARQKGLDITPVWNKSNREHTTVNSQPGETRTEADNAVRNLKWDGSWHVDADHINMGNVDRYIESSDFFTIDVADYIGHKASVEDLESFIENNTGFTGDFSIPGIEGSFKVSGETLRIIGEKFLSAIKEAAKIYRHIESAKGKGNFITEISMDEVSQSQSPLELFFILSAIAAENIPVQTIAPKFSGRFNKGVDYEGDTDQFAEEFEQDLMVIDFAVSKFNLPENLKLSVHSGSDKFSIYPAIGKLIRKYDKGIHIKTAGTTWLEEMTGLALAGGDALDLARRIYSEALMQFNELCKPYSSVIDINKSNLPSAEEVSSWDGTRFADALRHDQSNPSYNPDMRQLVHVAYKIAAGMGNTYTDMLKTHKEIIAKQVTDNIYHRHFSKIFKL